MSFRLVIDPSFEDNLGKPIEEVVERIADEVLGNMRRTVPVRDGGLKDSLTKFTEGSGAQRVVAVGSDPDHVDPNGVRVGNRGAWIEYGTEKMAAQPFARPALYQARQS